MQLIHQQTGPQPTETPVFLLCVFRDEWVLLEYFVSYYRKLGVSHFIMIDNGSTDGGAEYLESIPDIGISLYRTTESYRDAAYGMSWINRAMAELCQGHYCLVVDADELFVYDSRTYGSLRDLMGAMQDAGANVVPTTLLDMYPHEINDSYVRGADFLSHSGYFDAINSEYYEARIPIYGNFLHKFGGVRKRALGARVCIHKFPFFRYDFHPLEVGPGCHIFQANGEKVHAAEAIRLFRWPAVLLHFKFVKPGFRRHVERRIANNEDWDNSVEYARYLQALDSSQVLRFYDPAYSRLLEGIDDLDCFFNTWDEP